MAKATCPSHLHPKFPPAYFSLFREEIAFTGGIPFFFPLLLFFFSKQAVRQAHEGFPLFFSKQPKLSGTSPALFPLLPPPFFGKRPGSIAAVEDSPLFLSLPSTLRPRGIFSFPFS